MKRVVYECDWCGASEDAVGYDEDRPREWREVPGADDGGHAALLCVECQGYHKKAVDDVVAYTRKARQHFRDERRLAKAPPGGVE